MATRAHHDVKPADLFRGADGHLRLRTRGDVVIARHNLKVGVGRGHSAGGRPGVQIFILLRRVGVNLKNKHFKQLKRRSHQVTCLINNGPFPLRALAGLLSLIFFISLNA